MPKYEAEIEIPFFHEVGDLQEFVEHLREFGHPKIIFRIEAPTRKEARESVAESCSSWWPKYDDGWWDRVLRVIRGKRAQDEI